MNKLEVGQRVGVFFDSNDEEKFTTKPRVTNEYGSGPAFGKVMEVLGNGKVKVLFDKDHAYLNESTPAYSPKTGKRVSETKGPLTMDAKYLLPEDEAKAKLSSLETDFKNVEKQVKVKLKEAADSIREANKLAKEIGTNLFDMGAGYGSLYSAMDAAGWHTSSFGCWDY